MAIAQGLKGSINLIRAVVLRNNNLRKDASEEQKCSLDEANKCLEEAIEICQREIVDEETSVKTV